MKKNIFLTVLIGIFISVGLCYFFYDKLFFKEDVKEELLNWDIYEDNLFKSEIFLQLYEKELGLEYIFKDSDNSKISKDDFTSEEIIASLFKYYQYIYNDSTSETVAVDSLNKMVKELYGNISYEKIDEVNVNNYEKLVYDSKNKQYSIVENDNEATSYIYINDFKLDAAYQYGDTIYYDYLINFIKVSYKRDGSISKSLATDYNFENIFCTNDECKKSNLYSKYRIVLKYYSENESYVFDNAYKIGSDTNEED